MKRLSLSILLLAGFLPLWAEAQTYQQTVIVSPTVGNRIASGNALRSAVAGITDAAWGKRYLVKVEPGVYDLEQDPVLMKPFVDIEGSGRGVTLLRGRGRDGTLPYEFGVVQGADNSELRSLSVHATGDENAERVVIALYTEKASSFRDIDISVSGGRSCWGVRSTASTPKITDLNIWMSCSFYGAGIAARYGSKPLLSDTMIQSRGAATEDGNVGVFLDQGPHLFRGMDISVGNAEVPGIGVYLANHGTGGWFEISHSSIHTSGGIGLSSNATLSLKIRHSNFVANRVGIDVLQGQYLFVHNSLVAGTEATIYADFVRVGASQLEGGPLTAASAVCAGVYDENFTFFANNCP